MWPVWAVSHLYCERIPPFSATALTQLLGTVPVPVPVKSWFLHSRSAPSVGHRCCPGAPLQSAMPCLSLQSNTERTLTVSTNSLVWTCILTLWRDSIYSINLFFWIYFIPPHNVAFSQSFNRMLTHGLHWETQWFPVTKTLAHVHAETEKTGSFTTQLFIVRLEAIPEEDTW